MTATVRWLRLVVVSVSVLASGGTFAALATIVNAEISCEADCQSRDDGCPPLCPGCTCGHLVTFVDMVSPPSGRGRTPEHPRLPSFDELQPDDAPRGRLFEPPRA